LVAASTRGGTRPLSPAFFSLQQHQFDRHLFQCLGKPGDLGLGLVQFDVAFPRFHPGPGRRQRRQRPVLGDGTNPHHRGPVHLIPVRRLVDRHFLSDQLQPDLVLAQRGQELLGAPASTIDGAVLVEHDQSLPDGSRGPTEVV